MSNKTVKAKAQVMPAHAAAPEPALTPSAWAIGDSPARSRQIDAQASGDAMTESEVRWTLTGAIERHARKLEVELVTARDGDRARIESSLAASRSLLAKFEEAFDRRGGIDPLAGDRIPPGARLH